MDAVEEVKQRLSIEDVIGMYVQLKRSGRNFKGLSPFSSEKTPSLMVSPEKQIWHDFSSGKGGNMFSFVMDMEGLDFKAALEMLARQAGVDLSQYQSSRKGTMSQNKEPLYEALALAAKFYQVHLTKNKQAAEYVFSKRKFSKQTVLDFQIGYSPNNGTAVVDFLKRKGYSDSQLKQVGLATSRYGGLGDMFRGRIMIPLADPVGRIIGFTARILEDNPNAPKYINTPQTLFYDKSRHVYGLHLAKQAIRQNNYAVLVEGNLDVIASHQAGVRQVVATAGTALTEYHLKGLARFTADIRLSFDQDDAGLKASERAIPIASKVGVSLSIISLPSGKDPDELIKQSIASWQKAIEQHQYALDWLIDRYKKRVDINSGQGKREFSDLIVPIIRGLSDRVEQEHYTETVANLIGVSKEALQSKLSQTDKYAGSVRKKSSVAVAPVAKDQLDRLKIQDHLLALAAVRKELREYLKPVTSDMLIEKQAQQLLTFLNRNSSWSIKDNSWGDLQSIGDYIKILVLQYEELYGDLDKLELQYEASRLQTKLIQQYVKIQKEQLIARLHEANELDTNDLLQRVKQLDTLLRNTKGDANAR